MRASSALALATLLLPLAPSTARARADAAGASPRYVTVDRSTGHAVLRPTRHVVHRYPRGHMKVTCFSVARTYADGTSTTSSTEVRARVRPGLAFPVPRDAGDYCLVRVTPRHGSVPPEQPVAITLRGRRHLRLRGAALRVMSYVSFAYELDPPRLPSTDQLASRLHLTALASPDTPVAPGTTGIWSDGSGRVAVRTTLATGRSLFMDYDRATNTTRTNFLDLLLELDE